MGRRNDSGYWNHMAAMEENEEMRIEYIKKNPRYKTRKEYEVSLAKFKQEIDDCVLKLRADEDLTGSLCDVYLKLQEDYDSLKEEFDLVFSRDEMARLEEMLSRKWDAIIYYDEHNKALARQCRKEYDELYAEYRMKFLDE